jgi:hypothetical protein
MPQPEETPALGDDSGRSRQESALLAKKRRLELSRCDVERRLSLATAEPHREMLRRALEALDTQIAALPVLSRED